jgi:hypothetical protein
VDDMNARRNPVTDHLREMDRRIQEQQGEIDRLGKAGQDTARAEQRLSLLRRAMNEMRHQLSPLSPTRMDSSRPAGPIGPKPAKKK